jgi:rhodanese-related sulfurtransferase
MLMMKHVVSMVLLVFIVFAYGVVRADDTHAMTKEQLLPLLGKPDVIIIDVSSNEGWDGRDKKIPGALREEPMKFESWMNKYPKDKTIVLYCS